MVERTTSCNGWTQSFTNYRSTGSKVHFSPEISFLYKARIEGRAERKGETGERGSKGRERERRERERDRERERERERERQREREREIQRERERQKGG